ncbi:Pyruvate decarboxylase [Lachnellula hyalina]|uniref:Pyruvate decarboxylase n=1 Tax=Lachnellula hyalina TaxID=1316788 RepID=A0A8H8R6D3_9HELO|nr:Pyruvate decarboxylase [Lachnellula hyalina]TVY28535.1 Pyruvate decarboxylase [Lachnellula hyalina]
MTSTISMGQYLFKRVAELGIEHIFGVPGDFNLTLLDELFKVHELDWLGVCNELNGAYAADGYARIKGVPGVLVTTYAVGELSAMNGVAGAYAEHAGMIHVVGMPGRAVQEARLMLHHTMEPGMDQTVYVGMAEPIRKTHTILTDEKTMAQEIDRVIEAGVKSKLPVYIYVPMDVVGIPLDASRLEKPLNTKVVNSNSQMEDEVVQSTLELIRKSSKPSILADVLTIRHGGRELARRLANATQFPTYSTPLSKGVFDETDSKYNGVYNGEVSFPGCADSLESSDLVLNVGFLLSDSNTGGFTRKIPNGNLVLLGHDYCQIHDKKFDGIHFLPVLKRIVEEIEKDLKQYGLPKSDTRAKVETPVLSTSTSGPITQSYIWQRIGRFLLPNDIILTESGTAQFGLTDAVFPASTQLITQTFWSSIGYTVGACLGALVASKEAQKQKQKRSSSSTSTSDSPSSRVILIVGDGSLQMTVQEIGSYIRFNFTPIIFVINNDGYAIERAIHGPGMGYNDISMLWDHQAMLGFLGAREGTGIKGRSFACRDVEELERVLGEEEFAGAGCIQMCEIFIAKLDYPWRLSAQIAVSRQKMAQAMALQA